RCLFDTFRRLLGHRLGSVCCCSCLLPLGSRIPALDDLFLSGGRGSAFGSDCRPVLLELPVRRVEQYLGGFLTLVSALHAYVLLLHPPDLPVRHRPGSASTV